MKRDNIIIEDISHEANNKDIKSKKLKKVGDKINNKETYNFLNGIPYMDKSNNNSRLYTVLVSHNSIEV